MGRPTAIPGTLTLQDSAMRGQEETECTAHARHPSRWSPGPWLLVPQDPLLAVVFSCCLIFPQAHRPTAYHPSSNSIFGPHLLAQQEFMMSNGVQLWNQDAGVPAPALTMGHNQHQHLPGPQLLFRVKGWFVQPAELCEARGLRLSRKLCLSCCSDSR